MTCPRCQSRMIIDSPFSCTSLECSEASYSDLYHCIMCGHYSDRVIRANRLIQQAETIAKLTQLQEAV